MAVNISCTIKLLWLVLANCKKFCSWTFLSNLYFTELASISNKMNYLPFDDVYFTGILARTIGVNHVYWPQYRNVRLTAGYELTHHKQESIPVGCVPPACWPASQGVPSRHPASQTTPLLISWMHSLHSTLWTEPLPGWNPPELPPGCNHLPPLDDNPLLCMEPLLWTNTSENITFPQLCLRAVKSPTNCLLVTCTLIIKMFLVIKGSHRSQVF